MRDDQIAIAREKQFVDKLLNTQLRNKNRIKQAVPRNLILSPLNAVERKDLRNMLQGHATPQYLYQLQANISGPVYADKYKNDLRSYTVLLNNLGNAELLADTLEGIMPVKCFFIPYAQWTSSRTYAYIKLKVVYCT